MIDEIRIYKRKNGVEILPYINGCMTEPYVARFAPLDDYARRDGKAFCSTINEITEVLKPLLEQMDREYVEANTENVEGEKA